MTQSAKNYKRIVIKVGSSLFCSKKGEFDKPAFDRFVRQLALLANSKKDIIIVSSGAIALGMVKLGLKSRPKELSFLQAAAAIGQNMLMDNYSRAFKESRISLSQAQVLLTWDDFNDRSRYLNAKNTLVTLLKLGCIPIINENDTVSTDEIKFGDNDRLSALVATMVSADLLIMLSDVDGLLDLDKKLVKIVSEINAEVKALAAPSEKKTSVGGMVTKIQAAKMAVDSGIACVIANGKSDDIIGKIVAEPLSAGSWTVFLPKKGLAERDRWIAFGTKPKGRIIVDDGAKKALLNNKSLLSVGISATENNFDCGCVVSVMDKCGNEFARGKTGFSSKKIEEVKGGHFDKEIIHRDNIVIL